MGNDLMMRMKDQVLIVLADYQSCSLEHEVYLDQEIERIGREVAKRIVSNYLILSGRKQLPKFMSSAKDRIEAEVMILGRAKRDPWAACRDEGSRIRVAYAVARIIEKAAGGAHKFSVWSCLVYTGNNPILKKFKTEDHRGVRLLIAAPSKKKGVEMVNQVLGAHETVSWANDHWSGGGTIGEKVATKVGIWAAKDEHVDEKGYKLIWEPKS